MTNNRFTSLLLTVIALCLILLVAENWKSKTTTVQAAAVTRYEYKVLVRGRGLSKQGDFYGVNDWNQWWEDGSDENKGSLDMVKKSKELGAQGWELVAVIPEAGNATYSGLSDGLGYTSGGVTSVEKWIFKRPM